MRIRTIKPEFFMHDGLFEAERESKLPLRVAFVGLWCAADREGRFRWEPRRLGAQILPYDDIDFSRVLHALVTRGFLVQYRVGDACFGAIPSWKRHQIVNNKERPSEIPNHTEGELVDACPTRAPRVPNACHREGKGREGNMEGNMISSAGAVEHALPTRDEPDHFADFWTAYPRREGKAAARKAFEKLVDHPRIVAAARQYAAAVAQWRPEERKYVPHPATWLNQGRYDDDPATWMRNAPPDNLPPETESDGITLKF